MSVKQRWLEAIRERKDESDKFIFHLFNELEILREENRVLRQNNKEACQGRHEYMDRCSDLNKENEQLKECISNIPFLPKQARQLLNKLEEKK